MAGRRLFSLANGAPEWHQGRYNRCCPHLIRAAQIAFSGSAAAKYELTETCSTQPVMTVLTAYKLVSRGEKGSELTTNDQDDFTLAAVSSWEVRFHNLNAK